MSETKEVCLSLKEIRPFVRFAKYIPIRPDKEYPFKISYEYRLFYVYSGTGIIAIDHTRYIVSKGDFFLFSPGTRYSFTSSAEFPMVLLNFYFDFTQSHSHVEYIRIPSPEADFDPAGIVEKVRFNDSNLFNHVVHIKNFYLVEEALREMVEEDKFRRKYYSDRMSSIMASIVYMAARHMEAGFSGENEAQYVTDRILEYIHQNFNQPISNRQIAAYFNFHPNYLNRLLSDQTGTSLHQYVLNLRINKALELIHSSDKTLSEIAAEVGFNSLDHFSKHFKKKVGYTPSSAR